MKINRKATKEKGVYQVESQLKTYKGKPDICFYIAFKIDGKLTWEKVGWKSEGYSVKLAAQVRAERVRAKRHSKELPQQKKKAPLFKDLAEKYLKWSTENKSRAGIDDKSRYENHLKARFDNKRLDEIVLLDLERMKSEMSKPKSSTGKPISPKTISHCLALIRAMYNWAIDRDLFKGENPVKKKRPGEKNGIMPTVQNARDRFLSIEEADLLLKELKRNHRFKKEYRELEDPKLHDIALISLHTGARAGEIFNLKGQDIDFKNKLIALRDTKNTETRYQPMTTAVKEMLNRRIPENLNDYIFTDDDGNKIKEVSNAFDRVIDRLGFNKNIADRRQRIVFHSCRHSYASWLAIGGTPIYTISRLMGHKSISMTMRYSHLSPDHKKDAVDNLEAALKKHKSQITEVEAEE